jgi:nucleoside-diphosphate-sugar epimerase
MTAAAHDETQRYLIIGASGFIGSQVAKSAMQAGHQVTVTLRGGATTGGDRADHTIENFDITHPDAFEARLSSGHYDVIVLAAAALNRVSSDASTGLILVDGQSLIALLDAVKSYQPKAKVIIFGSGLSYANSNVASTEKTPLDMGSVYATSKAICSTIASHYRSAIGLTITELRLFNVYGPGDNSNRLIPYCLRCLFEARPASLKDTSQMRDFVFIDDVCRVVHAAALGKLPAGVFNVCSGLAVGIDEVARQISDLGGFDILHGSKLPSEFEVRPQHFGSPGKLEKFGLAPKTSLREGLQRTLDCLKQQN